MGQTSSRHAAPTRKSSRPTRSTRSPVSKYSRQYTVSDDAVENANAAPKSKHRNIPHRSEGQDTKSFSKHPRNTSGNVTAPKVRERQHGVTRSQRKNTTSDRRYSHDEAGSAHRHDIKTPSNPKSGSHQRKPKMKKECVVCTDSRSLFRFPSHAPTQQCTHNADVCRRCLRTWIRTTFTSKIWDEINCPTCSEHLDYEDVREFAPSDVFRKYDKLSAKAALEATPGFRWCIMKGCESGQVLEEASNKFRCKGCGQSHCVEHNVVWHKRETCKKYDYRTNKNLKKEEEKASKKLIAEIAKICPGCERPVEKSYGCDHMTCTKCRHEFCWQCLAPYNRRRDSNYRRGISYGAVSHNAGCLYFGENVENRPAVWEEGFLFDP